MSKTELLIGISGLYVASIALAGLYVMYVENQTMKEIVIQQQEYTRDLTNYVINFDNAISKKLSSDDKVDHLIINTIVKKFKDLDEKISELRK